MEDIKIDIFSYINTINKKVGIYPSDNLDIFESTYSQYVVNIALMRYADTIMIIEQLSLMNNLTNQQHFEYLYNTVPKSNKRYGKWHKPPKDEYIDLVMLVYKYSYEKAKSVIDLFKIEDLELLKTKYLSYGGVKK
jgi:hypothetical protein